MTTRTTIRSWRAMAVAGVILTGTCFVLFQDIYHGAAITTGHVLTALALIIATAAGHQIVPTFKAGRYALTLSMIVLALGAIAYVGLMSGARNAEVTATKAEGIEGVNAERDRIVKLRTEAQAMLSKAMKEVAAKCHDGVGKHCKGAEKTRDVYDAAVRGHNADLAKLPAAQTPNAGYKAIAEGIVLLPWFTAHTVAEVERTLIVLLPWLAVLLAELSVPAFLSLALGHETIETRKTADAPVPSFSDTAQSSFSTDGAADVRALISGPLPEPTDNDGPVPPLPPKGRRTRKKMERAIDRKTTTPSNVVAFPARHPVIAALENVGRHVSNGELAQLMGCSDSEATKRWKEVADLLDLGWQGRFRSIGLKTWSATAATA